MASVLHRVASATLEAALTEGRPKRRLDAGAVRAVAAGFALGTVGLVAARRGARLARGEMPAERSSHRGTRRSPTRAITDARRADEPPRPAASARRPSDDDAMTRSEEELDVRTVRRERGRVRLRKYVVTEEVQRTIPVRREEIRVEEVSESEEGTADASVNTGTVGEQHDGEEQEIVLHEEVPVIEKRVRPRERVRIVKETRRDEEPIVEEVRAERIEAEGDLER